jgi:hypothetical protein
MQMIFWNFLYSFPWFQLVLNYLIDNRERLIDHLRRWSFLKNWIRIFDLMFKMRVEQAFLAQELIVLFAIKHSFFIFVFRTFYFEFFESNFTLWHSIDHPKVFGNHFSGGVLYTFVVNRALDDLRLFIVQSIYALSAQAMTTVKA